jgi:hypothetical protein
VPPALACDRRYDTTAAGIGMLVPGAALLGTGILALALPGPRRQVLVPKAHAEAALGAAAAVPSRPD